MSKKITLIQDPVTLKPGEAIRVTVNDVVVEAFVSTTAIETGLYMLQLSLINPADRHDVLSRCETTTLIQ